MTETLFDIIKIYAYRDGGTKIIRANMFDYTNVKLSIQGDVYNVIGNGDEQLITDLEVLKSLEVALINTLIESNYVSSSINFILNYVDKLKNPKVQLDFTTVSEDTLKFAEWLNIHGIRRDLHEWKSRHDNYDKVYTTKAMYRIYEKS